jgi:hypothetical protein
MPCPSQDRVVAIIADARALGLWRSREILGQFCGGLFFGPLVRECSAASGAGKLTLSHAALRLNGSDNDEAV